MVNGRLVVGAARKHFGTNSSAPRQHSLISKDGGRSRLTAAHFVFLLRCHCLTAGVEEVTRQRGGERRGGWRGGADLGSFCFNSFFHWLPEGRVTPPPPRLHPPTPPACTELARRKHEPTDKTTDAHNCALHAHMCVSVCARKAAHTLQQACCFHQ